MSNITTLDLTALDPSQLASASGGQARKQPSQSRVTRPAGPGGKVVAPDITMGLGKCLLKEFGVEVKDDPNVISGGLSCDTHREIGKVLATRRR